MELNSYLVARKAEGARDPWPPSQIGVAKTYRASAAERVSQAQLKIGGATPSAFLRHRHLSPFRASFPERLA